MYFNSLLLQSLTFAFGTEIIQKCKMFFAFTKIREMHFKNSRLGD